jgi:hypothetical protein
MANATFRAVFASDRPVSVNRPLTPYRPERSSDARSSLATSAFARASAILSRIIFSAK